MRISDTIDMQTFGETSFGIFNDIYSLGMFEWLSQSQARNLDIEYYLGRSGDKEISVLFRKLLVFQDYRTKLAKIISNKYLDKWNKIYSALVDSTYDPLANYDMYEKETPNLTNETDTSNSTYGFNSSQATPTDTGKAKTTQTGNRVLERKGNIGVTSSQQLLKSELDLRSQNIFYNIMLRDVDLILTKKIYS